jgi:hypothetical protein
MALPRLVGPADPRRISFEPWYADTVALPLPVLKLQPQKEFISKVTKLSGKAMPSLISVYAHKGVS